MNEQERIDLIRRQFLSLEEKDAEIATLREEVATLQALLKTVDVMFANGCGVEIVTEIAKRLATQS
jgi:hypothetical protein